MDAVAMVVDAINSAGIGATAYPDVPSKRPEEFFVVELTGGSSPNRVQASPSVDIDCWAKSRSRASQLAESAKSVVLSLQDTEQNVFHASVTTTYNNPDLESGTPRYTVGVDIEANE